MMQVSDVLDFVGNYFKESCQEQSSPQIPPMDSVDLSRLEFSINSISSYRIAQKSEFLCVFYCWKI